MRVLVILSFLFIACTAVERSGHDEFFKLIWVKSLESDYDTGNMPIALHSPLIYKDYLFSGHNDGFMTAYDIKNGREVWRTQDNGGYHAAPVIFDDYLIYGTVQGRVYARHYKTGELKYAVDLDNAVETQGTVHNGRIFFQTRNHKIFALDVSTGKILWGHKRSVPFLTTLQRASRPVVYRNKLYVGFADGYVVSFGIEDGVLLWEQKIAAGNKFIDVDMTPFFHNNRLYIGSMSGVLNILEPETGNILQQTPYYASRPPLADGDFIFMGTQQGEVLQFNKQWEVVGRRQLTDVNISSLIKWKKRLLVSTVKGDIYCLNPQNLAIEASFELGSKLSAVFGQMSATDDVLALLSSRNRLYVFR